MELAENLVVADRFRLVRMIGRGGMGSVWKAINIALDQPCALKFIETELAAGLDAQARFQREARAAAQLGSSPHVVQVMDHGVWQGRPYIAMELLEGDDLGKTLAKAGGKLPPATVFNVIEQVSRALTRAHQAGIVHRDLKPDNVFIVHDDDRILVKILDFGVAKQASTALEGSTTKTGAMLGTPFYMSPEQAQGIKTVDARSDLWSLAVIVFQAITGRLPFESEALGDLLVRIIVNPLPIPSQLAPVPPAFDRWWAKAADRNPDARFQSAKEFATTLAAALAEPVLEPARAPAHATALMPQVGSNLSHTGPRTPPNAGLAASPMPYTAPLGAIHAPSMPTAPPVMRTPGNLQGQPYAANPITFSDANQPNGVPKRSSTALIVGIAMLGVVVVGVVVIVAVFGLGLTKQRPTVAGQPPSAAASRPAAISSPVEPTPVPEPTPVEPDPTPSATPAASSVVPRPIQPPAPGPAPLPVKPKPSASIAPSASTKKWVPGF